MALKGAGSVIEARRLAQSYPKIEVPTAPPSPSVRDARVPSAFQVWAASTVPVAALVSESARPALSYAMSIVSTRVGAAPSEYFCSAGWPSR